MTNEIIQARFAELGHEVELSDIENRISVLTGQFKVPIKDAESSVVSFFLRQLGVDRADYYEGSTGGQVDVSVADIPQKEDNWVNLRVKFVKEWDTTSDFIRQTGLVGDETGQIKFVIWANSGLHEMTEGKCYSLDNIVTNVYNERVSVSLNRTSVITELDDDIEVGFTTAEFTGALVMIKEGSGLIKRCPECNRALKSGTCSEHGNVEGEYDLRIMGVLDNGVDMRDILLGRELTEQLWGHSLEDGTKMAIDALDASIVLDDMRNSLVGRYYSATGSMMEYTMLAEFCDVV